MDKVKQPYPFVVQAVWLVKIETRQIFALSFFLQTKTGESASMILSQWFYNVW